MPLIKAKQFFQLESAPGILLFFACVIALAMKNSPIAWIYDTLLLTPVAIKIGEFAIDKPLLLWINDGLMAVFFLFVGLEIKREMIQGQLSTRDQAILPLLAAIGGIVMPALIYIGVNYSDSNALKGWAIPAATDIAFALGIIAVLGNRIPPAIKICLLAIAIIDDLAAIVIIALFYTRDLSLYSLGFAVIAITTLLILNRKKVTNLGPYILTGILLWTCVLKSGVHATLAGVIIALLIPLKIKEPNHEPPLISLEHALHPWVSFGVLPVFAFANAGVSLKGLSFSTLLEPITLGIIAGLMIGKPLGVMGFTWLGGLLKICKLPKDISWQAYFGMALLTGVGFTMSLFIGTLAFDDVAFQNAVRLGVLFGSAVAGLLGYFMLRWACPVPVEHEQVLSGH